MTSSAPRLPPFMSASPLGAPSRSSSRSRPTTSGHAARGSEPLNDVEERLAYTETLLARYQNVVETNLKPQLASYAATCDELGEEVEVLRRENGRLNDMVKAAVAEMDAVRKRRDDDARDAAAEKAQVARLHQDHIDAVRRECDARVAELDREVKRLQSEMARFTDATVRAADADAQRRADDMQQVLHLREAEVRRLRQLLAEKEAALEESEKRAVEAAPIASSVATVVGELRQFVAEAADFAVALGAAFNHISVDASPLAACWRSLAAAPNGAAATLKDALAELAMLAVGIRSAARQEKVALGQCLRQVVTKQAQLVAQLAASETEHHSELVRSRKRIEELESDRRAEREQMEQRIEKERLRAMLAGSPSRAAPSGGSGGASSGTLGTASSLVTVTKATSSCTTQTTSELWDIRVGGGSAEEQSAIAKLRAEIGRLQDEVAHYRETIQMLERQRKHFLFFVDDEDVSAEVQQTLSGSRSSFIRQHL